MSTPEPPPPHPAPPGQRPTPRPRRASVTRAATPRPELRLVPGRGARPPAQVAAARSRNRRPVRPAGRRPPGGDDARPADPQHRDRRRLAQGHPAADGERPARPGAAAPRAAGGAAGTPAEIARAAEAPGLVPAGSTDLVIDPDGTAVLRGTPSRPRSRSTGAPPRRGLTGAEPPDRGPGAGPRTTGRTCRTSVRPRSSREPGRLGPGRSPRRTPAAAAAAPGLSMDQRGLRNRWGLVVMITLLVLVVGRLAVLQGVDGAAYANAAEQDRLRTYPIAALRGGARPGRQPFAYTVAASRDRADPTVVADPDATARGADPAARRRRPTSRSGCRGTAATSCWPPRSPRRSPTRSRSSSSPACPRGRPGPAVPGRHGRRAGHRLRRPRGRRAGRHRAGLPGRTRRYARVSGASRWAAAATSSPRASTSPPRPRTATP